MRRVYSNPGKYRKIFLANYLCGAHLNWWAAFSQKCPFSFPSFIIKSPKFTATFGRVAVNLFFSFLVFLLFYLFSAIFFVCFFFPLLLYISKL